ILRGEVEDSTSHPTGTVGDVGDVFLRLAEPESVLDVDHVLDTDLVLEAETLLRIGPLLFCVGRLGDGDRVAEDLHIVALLHRLPHLHRAGPRIFLVGVRDDQERITVGQVRRGRGTITTVDRDLITRRIHGGNKHDLSGGRDIYDIPLPEDAGVVYVDSRSVRTTLGSPGVRGRPSVALILDLRDIGGLYVVLSELLEEDCQRTRIRLEFCDAIRVVQVSSFSQKFSCGNYSHWYSPLTEL